MMLGRCFLSATTRERPRRLCLPPDVASIRNVCRNRGRAGGRRRLGLTCVSGRRRRQINRPVPQLRGVEDGLIEQRE